MFNSLQNKRSVMYWLLDSMQYPTFKYLLQKFTYKFKPNGQGYLNSRKKGKQLLM